MANSRIFPNSLNLLQYSRIFFNSYTVCFSLLLALQNLSENAETDTSDYFYIARRYPNRQYYEKCYVVYKSVILESGIFKQIPGLNCSVTSGTITISPDQVNPQITFLGYTTEDPNIKPIYWMSKSFIENIIRSSATDIFSMDEITIGSLFTQLQLKQYGNLSLNYMFIEDDDDAGAYPYEYTSFFMAIESNNNAQNYGYITWLKPGSKFYTPANELHLNHIKDFNKSHDITLAYLDKDQFKYFFSEKSCFAVENDANSNQATDCSEMEIAIRDFENLEINFTRTDVQSFTTGEGEFNVTLTKNNETNKYLAIYKARYPNNSETEIFHLRKTLDPNENRTNGIKEALLFIIIIGSVFLLTLTSELIIIGCICKKLKNPRNQETSGKIGVLEKGHPKPAGEIQLNDRDYQFKNQNYE